jgi:hypothetical protein
MELLVAVGLLAAVLAGAGMIFHYSIEAYRIASATTEIMRTLRTITDQLNIDLGFEGFQKDGYLVLRSDDSNSALYFFSTGDFQSWRDPDIGSNIARVYFGPAENDPNILALDKLLLTPGQPPPDPNYDYRDANFAACQVDIKNELGEDPCDMLSGGRPDVNMADNPDDIGRLLAQHVGSFKIEWTYGWRHPTEPNIIWWGRYNTGDVSANALADETGNLEKPDGTSVVATATGGISSAIHEDKGPPYAVQWDPNNQSLWPKALKFTFTIYDSKKILKGGRKFEHIVYIGN